MSDKQKTIKNEVTLKGVGLHTGKEVTLTFKPSDVNTGIRFLRKDIGPDAFIEASAEYVVNTSRGTTIEKNQIRVATIEHALAAVTGLQINNLIIEIDCPETPILDGSAKHYVEALKKADIVEQEALIEYLELKETIHFYDEEKDCEIIAVPSDRYRISSMIDFQSKVLPPQHAKLDNLEDFAEQIAPCRTFVFLHELEMLLANNLIKGGDLNNAIVFVDKAISQVELDKLATVFEKPSVSVQPEGILNNLELYFNNEPARHKLLDIIGDLTLVGKPIKAHIIARKPGHMSNIKFAKELISIDKKQILDAQIPKYDPTVPPIYDINKIKKMLPHRYPFLLVDKVIELSDSHVVGVKNVTANEEFFTGHFPNEPVMPGVLQIEALAQAGGLFIFSTIPDPENYSTYFLKIDNAKFKQKVVPGDTLLLKCTLLTPVRRGLCHMQAYAYVGNKIVMEAEIMAQIVKNVDLLK
ncbi:MAG: bifunctional UDP-3-O-[3-hydroxymyristoyl] N-acetylglucosamine deacetylase/3-hydroxyacyl-ACP dehydratase [Bacteroidetes bacterium]|nr:bifunctional UDP-3-O-[3-hydroxymyristoyl] N-acetylglucosamine deacetylase/3-hydroxyacyl-ACP dehydratase [Bacteroidota bacterium]